MPDSSKKNQGGFAPKKKREEKDFTTFVLPAGKEIIYYAGRFPDPHFQRTDMKKRSMCFADYEVRWKMELPADPFCDAGT